MPLSGTVHLSQREKNSFASRVWADYTNPLLVFCHRSLWSIRSYIHIMLCGSMFTAQLTFVVGVDRTGSEVQNPITFSSQCLYHVKQTQDWCAAISVLLLYLFLVMFMWMLMEGVVLYLVLIKVSVRRSQCYIAAFTALSFGQTYTKRITNHMSTHNIPQA